MATTMTMQGFVKQARRLVQGIQARRLALGDLINEAHAQGHSYTALVQALRDDIPNLRDMLGYALTPQLASALAQAARVFRADEGLVDPQGLYSVTREEVEALGLQPAELAALASVAKSGGLRVKTLAAATRAVQESGLGSKRADKALERLHKAIGKAQGKAEAPEKGSRAEAQAKIVALNDQIAALDKRKAELVEQRKRWQAQLAAMPLDKPAPKAEAKPRRRRAKADPGAQAIVG